MNVKGKFLVSSLIFGMASLPAYSNFEYDMHGFIKAGLSRSNKGLKTYGADGFRAPTEAANQANDVATVNNADRESQSSIQTAQTRWGVKIKNGDNVTGRLEFDATGVNGSSDTAIKTRLRLASIDFKVGNGNIFAGQKWVTFAGLNPHVVNMVGAGFRSGNSGFIGHEIGYSHNYNGFIGTVALGNKGSNTTGTTTATELGNPLVTLRLDYKNDLHHGGIAFVTGELKHKDVSAANENSDVQGFKVFYSGNFGNFNIKGELFSGSNLNSLGFLTLASASVSDSKDRDELGFFISGKHKFGEDNKYAIILGYGQNEVDEVTDFAQGALVENSVIRVGTEANVAKSLDTYFFVERFDSGYVNSSNTVTDSDAALIEAGLIYRF